MVNSFMIYINMFTHEVTWRIDEDIQNVEIEHLTTENREMILINIRNKNIWWKNGKIHEQNVNKA